MLFGKPLDIGGVDFCRDAADAAFISRSSANFRSRSTSFFVSLARPIASLTCDCACKNASFLSRASSASFSASFCKNKKRSQLWPEYNLLLRKQFVNLPGQFYADLDEKDPFSLLVQERSLPSHASQLHRRCGAVHQPAP